MAAPRVPTYDDVRPTPRDRATMMVEMFPGVGYSDSLPKQPHVEAAAWNGKLSISRTWAMPNKDTFSVKPIGNFVKKYLSASTVSVDPFARNRLWATHTNDIDPETEAAHHMDAVAFLEKMRKDGVVADLVILDPPYSPRQISECYQRIGKKVGMRDTQNSALYKAVRNGANRILVEGGIALSFGWNTSGIGKKRGFEQMEILICDHGGAHNATLCLAERKMVI